MDQMEKVKIAVFGDSLAFSRIHKGQLISDSWLYKLAEKCSVFLVCRARGGSTSRDVLLEIKHLSSYYGTGRQFDFVIVQVGIVDCCPRSAPPENHYLLRCANNIPLIGRHIKYLLITAMKKLSPTLGINFPLIGIGEFKNNVSVILRRSLELGKNVIFVNIVKPANYLIANAPGVLNYWHKYSNEIKKACEICPNAFLVDWPSETYELLLPDGHHLTTIGHDYLADKIVKVLNKVC